MITQQPTVHVKPITGYPALKMIWQHRVKEADVQPAFQDIMTALQEASSSLYVVVDLSKDPMFPLVETVYQALRGPFRNPKLAEWLVFSSNGAARTIGETLSKTARRNNIRWFDDEDEALAYLDAICP